jgi:hypothetical protein
VLISLSLCCMASCSFLCGVEIRFGGQQYIYLECGK